MLPATLALVDDDAEYAEYLGHHLQEQGVAVTVFSDAGSLLADRQAYEFGFYVLDLSLPDVDGLELLRILRRRSGAGVLVVTGRLAPDVFESVLGAGADMYLAKPVRFEQVRVAVEAVERRIRSTRDAMVSWKLDRQARELVAPDGVRVPLSGTDMAVMECFVSAAGAPVARDVLRQCLFPDAEGGGRDNLLHATIYRLRRRIERATPVLVPLQSQARIGYVFQAPLTPL